MRPAVTHLNSKNGLLPSDLQSEMIVLQYCCEERRSPPVLGNIVRRTDMIGEVQDCFPLIYHVVAFWNVLEALLTLYGR